MGLRIHGRVSAGLPECKARDLQISNQGKMMIFTAERMLMARVRNWV